MSSKNIAANPVGGVYVSTMIGETLQRGGLVTSWNDYNRQVIVDGVDPTSKFALTYIVAKDGVAGPDPSKHEGVTKLDAIVQNVAEDLSVVGLSFNKDAGKYEGEFDRF